MPAEKTESTFALSYTVACEIQAPPSRVWSLLTDATGFPSWNSTVSRLDGPIALGRKLTIEVPLAPGRKFTPKVTGFDVDRQMVWQDGMWPMFQGRRTFDLVAKAGGVEFRMTEVFTGVMLPMIKGSLPDFREAFATYAQDLKRAAEAT
jgi:hypothetical protein